MAFCFSMNSRPPLPARRALAVLAKLPGATIGLLLAYGIKDIVITKLIAGGLVTAWTEHVGVSDRRVEVTRINITDAGRAALRPLAQCRHCRSGKIQPAERSRQLSRASAPMMPQQVQTMRGRKDDTGTDPS